MPSRIWTVALAAFCGLAWGCSEGSRSTPTAAPEASVANVTAAVQAKTLVCHHNPDIDDGDPEWVAIAVANGDKYLANHPDDCELEIGVVGEACSCDIALSSAVAAAKDAQKFCHANPDVDDEDPAWVVIAPSSRSADAHVAHGDLSGACVDALEVGADCSSCLPV